MYDLYIHEHYHPEVGYRQGSSLPHVTIYSDGSYKPSINFGGYGTLMECDGQRIALYGGSPADSNNRMEITGVLAGLRLLNRPCEVTVISDSKYVIDALNGYIWNWQSSGWLTSQKKPVANVDLWKEMLMFCQIHRIHGQWIKGHTGHIENEHCDHLATIGAYQSANIPIPPSKQQLYDLSRNKSPGYEDNDISIDPNRQLII